VDPSADVGLLAERVAAGVVHQVRHHLAAAGFDDVREAQLHALEALRADGSTVTSLAARLGVSAQAVSKSVAELARAGYVVRGRDPGDRRARRLHLTARGEALVDASRRAREQVARDLRRWLGTRDQAELVRLLQHAEERLDALAAVTNAPARSRR
jgi:DNA-binding MarR family transcriptional regulator